MDDVPYGRILREGWIVILVAVILGGAAAFGITRLLPQTFAATSTLLLQVESKESSLFERSQFSQARIMSYPGLVDSPAVVSGVRSDLGLSPTEYSDRDIRRMLSATNTADTVLLEVRADASTAEMASDMANSAALHMSKQIEDMENEESDDRYVVRLVQVLPAVPPLSPISPQVIPISGLGVIIGLVAGVLIALYRTTTNQRLVTIADVRRASGLPVVGSIPRRARLRRPNGDADDAQSTAYSETVSNLLALVGIRQRALMLVQAEPEPVELDIVTGLARAFCRAGRKPLVLDARANAVSAEQSRSLYDLMSFFDDDEAADEPDADDIEARWESGEGMFFTSSGISVEAVESLLPQAVEKAGDSSFVLLILVDPEASALLAERGAPVMIGVRSRATTITSLVSIVSRLRVMDVRPLGVLMWSAGGRKFAPVSESWLESDRGTESRIAPAR